jgi:tryptophan 2-C-methyltransferase
MKILFINPNRYHDPPVMPIGLEYLAGAVTKAGHDVDVLDLCFSDNPSEELVEALQSLRPDIAGITVRQVDTALYRGNRFFLPEIRDYVRLCKKFGTPVVLGGSGFSIMPGKILTYTGAQYGIYGPGEQALVELLDELRQGASGDKNFIRNGYVALKSRQSTISRADIIDPSRYLQHEGIFGFRTQYGCNEACFFCVEAKTPVSFCDPLTVAREIEKLVDRGARKFHLCDPEFNVSERHCVDVCSAIVDITGPIVWTLYMKPEPVSVRLFHWLAVSGATMITLSIDTLRYRPKSYSRLEPFFFLARDNGIKVMVDLSVGYPDEPLSETSRMLDFLDSLPVTSVGVNSYFRVYPGTLLYKKIFENPHLQDHLLPGFPGDDFFAPVFFYQISEQELTPLLSGRQKFRLEGFDMATNYQRLKMPFPT